MKSGFTIIELLIAVAITGLLVVGTVSKFNNFNENQKVKTAAQKLRNDLRLVQSRAASGVKPSDCDVFDGYTVDFTTTSRATGYIVQGWCDKGDGCTNAQAEGQTVTYTLPRTISMNLTSTPPPATPTKILFQALSKGITLPTCAPISDLTVQFSGALATQNYNVVLRPSGDIDLE